MSGARSCKVHGGKFMDWPTYNFLGLMPRLAASRAERLRPCLRAMLAIVSTPATPCVCCLCVRVVEDGLGVVEPVACEAVTGWAGWLEISSGVALVVAGCGVGLLAALPDPALPDCLSDA